jgi:ecdysteroid 25-hydroxylase CYP302A1
MYSSPGLLPTNGPEWDRLRRAYQFRPDEVNLIIPSMDELASEAANMIKEGSNDPLTILKRYFFEVANVFFFGATYEGVREPIRRASSQLASAEEVMEAAAATNRSVLTTDNGLQMWRWFSSPSFRELASNQRIIEKFASHMLEK